MSDLDRLLRSTGDLAPLNDDALEQVRVRRHRRLRRTRLGSAAAVLLIAAGGLTWALGALGGFRSPDVPVDSSGDEEGVAYGISAPVPIGWALLELGADVRGQFAGESWPLLQLTNFEPGILESEVCPAESSIPRDGVRLYIQQDLRLEPEARERYRPWPDTGEGIREAGACGDGRRFYWRVGDHFFQGLITAGEGASEQDILALEHSFENLAFAPPEELDKKHDFDRGRPDIPLELGTPRRFLIAAEEGAGWAMYAMDDPEAGPDARPIVFVRWGNTLAFTHYSSVEEKVTDLGGWFWDDGVFLTPPVTEDVARVWAETDAGESFEGAIVEFPPAYQADFRIAVMEVVGARSGIVTAEDSQGEIVWSARFAPADPEPMTTDLSPSPMSETPEED